MQQSWTWGLCKRTTRPRAGVCLLAHLHPSHTPLLGKGEAVEQQAEMIPNTTQHMEPREQGLAGTGEQIHRSQAQQRESTAAGKAQEEI